MTRSEGLVVALFVLILTAWLIVHGLHKRAPAAAAKAATAANAARPSRG